MKIAEITRLDLLSPVRKIGSNSRSLTGRVAIGQNTSAAFESSLERDWLICLDFDPAVDLIVEQPFAITYEFEGAERRYTPDVLARYRRSPEQSSVLVFEVKPYEKVRSEFSQFRPRFKGMVHYCRERDWRFKIVTERQIRTPYLGNAKFLRKYRRMTEQSLFHDQLLYSMRALGPTTPQALLASAYLHEEKRMAALTELWRMIALREITTDFHKPLTMQSLIWMGDSRG